MIKKKNIYNLKNNYKIIIQNIHLYDTLHIFKFYTFYCVLLQIFYYFYILELNSITLLNIISTCSIGSWYICYIYPKKLFINGYLIDVYIDGYVMYIIDFFVHHLPLIYFIYYEKNNLLKNKINYIEIFSIPLAYRLLVDPYKIYKINFKLQFISLMIPITLLSVLNN